MPITEQERQQLRDRLKAAREAKALKAKKVPAAEEQAQEPPTAPVIAPVKPPVNELLAQLDAYEPVPTAKKPVPTAQSKEPEHKTVPVAKEKEKKKKYAKLVFYEAPTDKKQLKQLARALGGGQSDSEEEDEAKQRVWSRPRHEALPEPAPVPVPAPVPQEDPRQARMKKLNQMSRMFFD